MDQLDLLLNPAIAMPVIAASWFIGGVIILLLERMSPKPRYMEAKPCPCQSLPDRTVPDPVADPRHLALGRHHSGRRDFWAWTGWPRRKFTFFLAIPTMLGATVFELYKKGAALNHGQSLDIAVGFVVSFIVAYLVIRGFLMIVERYGLTPFGWYRIAAAIALAAYIYV